MCRVYEPAGAVSTSSPVPPIVSRKSLNLIKWSNPACPPSPSIPQHPPNLAPPPIAQHIILLQHRDITSTELAQKFSSEFRCWRPWLDRKGARVYDTFGAFLDSLIPRVCMPASADERWSCKVLLAVSIVLWVLSHSQCMQTASADEHWLFCASKWLRV